MEKGCYKKKKQTTGFDGQLYEVKLVMWFLLQGLVAVKDKTIDSFRIGSNVDFAGKFDDLVFQYVKNGKKYVHLIQAKHRENLHMRFTLEKFFSDANKKDYDIISYFKSYKVISKHYSEPANSVCEFKIIFFTNSFYQGKQDKKYKSAPLTNDDIFFHETLNGKGGKRFKIEINQHIHDKFKNIEEEDAKLIGDFMEKFEIWSHQPSQTEFDDIIKNKIKSMYSTKQHETEIIYNHVFNRVLSWWKLGYDKYSEVPIEKNEENAIYLDNRDNWFGDSSDILSKLTLKGGILFKKYNSKTIPLNFKPEATSALIEAIKNNRTTKIIIKKENKFLIDRKIDQVLENEFEDFIYLTINQLDWRFQQAIGDFSKRCNLLILDFIDAHHQIDDVFCELLKFIMNNNPEKKIVVIAEEPQSVSPFECEKTCDMTKVFFQDFEEDFQTMLLNEEITFQGNKITLCEILKNDVTLNEEVLVKLIRRENICIGHPLQNLGKTFDYHINRSLIRKRLVRNDFLMNSCDKIVISGITRKKFVSTFSYTGEVFAFGKYNSESEMSKFRLFIVRNENDYREVCLYYKEKLTSTKDFTTKTDSIHWLTTDTHKRLMWVSSEGSIVNLKKHMITDQIDSPNEIYQSCNKIVIVAAEPGMGKTTFLSSLAHHDRQEITWRGRINLSNDYKLFINLKIEDISIFDCVCNALGLNTEWERQIFEQYYRKEGRVELMFDGYDEIASDYKKTVIEMIKWLRDRTMVDKIWITARLSVLEDLENELNTMEYRLPMFTNDDSEMFLLRFWGKHVESVGEKKAKSAIKLFLNQFKLRTKVFISNPLQLEMLANVFEESFIELLNDNSPGFDRIFEEFNSEEFKVYSLYKWFINKKYFKVMPTKTRLDLINMNYREIFVKEFEDLENQHVNYAFSSLFDEETLKNIMNEVDLVKMRSSLDDVWFGIEKNGLINNVTDKRASFVHRTFAEFFVALGLSKMLEEPSNAKRIGDFLLRIEIFSKQQCAIRLFFNHCVIEVDERENKIKSNRIKFFNAAIANDVITIRKMLSRNEVDVNVKDNANRTVLHLTSFYNYRDIIELMIEHNVDVSIKDQLFNWTALHYADRNNMWNIVELLLKNNANPKHLSNAFGEKSIFDFCKLNFINLVKVLIQFNPSCINIVDETETPLHYAARNGLHDIVSLLLLHGARTIDRDLKGMTPLHCASEQGWVDVISLLLSSGADALAKDNNGSTPLHLAVIRNDLKCFKILMNKEPKCLNEKDSNGRTPFLIASYKGHRRIVEALIKTNPSGVNEVDKHKCTALHYVSKSGWRNGISLLLSSGADAFAKNSNDNTPFHSAIIRNDLPAVKMFINKEPKCLNENDDNGSTSLLIASREANATGLNEILDKRTSKVDNAISLHTSSKANEFDDDRSTPLHVAVIKNDFQAVKTLMNTEPKYLYEKDNNGRTPLLLACYKGHRRIAEALIKADPSGLNEIDILKRTPLHYASRWGWEGEISLLLDSGAVIIAKDNNGCTPLHEAVTKNKLGAVEVFISKKSIYLNKKDNNGRTPLLLACKFRHIYIAEALIKSNASGVNEIDKLKCTALHYVLKSGWRDGISLLLSYGADALVKDNNGATPLHLAVMRNDFYAVEVLMDEEPKCLYVKDDNGRTPLLIASYSGYREIAVALIEFNASGVNEVDKLKCSSLHYASQRGWEDGVSLLLDSGADALTKNNNGSTPLHEAVIENKLNAVKVFINKAPKCLNEKDNNERTPLLLASYKERNEIVVALIEANDTGVNEIDINKWTPLHYASRSKWRDGISLLLSYGANAFVKDNNGTTPLHVSVIRNDLHAVKMLMNKEPKCLNEKDINGRTPLLIASHNGYREIAVALIKFNASGVNEVDKLKCSSLHYASQRGWEDVISLLLKSGGDAFARDNNGSTPLHEAVIENELNAVKVFINEVPKCLNQKDNNERTPLLIAIHKGHCEIALVLNEANVCE